MNFKNINFSNFVGVIVELIFQTLRTIVCRVPLHNAVILSFIPNQFTNFILSCCFIQANFIFVESIFINNTDRLFSGQLCFFLKRPFYSCMLHKFK